jgi:hypothetical protein
VDAYETPRGPISPDDRQGTVIPLVAGGQGRDAEDTANAAVGICWGVLGGALLWFAAWFGWRALS